MRRYLLPIIIFLFSLVSVKSNAQVNVQDSLALVDFNDSTSGDLWFTPWNFSDPVSTWYGVTVTNNRVVSIVLEYNDLHGILPSSISNLTKLQTLDLPYNDLNGELTAALGNLKNLQTLHLFYNNLPGSIPSSLGNATALTDVDLSYNKLSGTVPVSMGNLINLTKLSLHDNSLTGTIPSALEHLTNIQSLDLSNNQFSGSIPVLLDSLVNATALNISNNNFDFGELSDLITFEQNSGRFVTTYAPQLPVPIYHNADTSLIYVSVGGNPYDNEYKFYKNDVFVKWQMTDSVFSISGAGIYRIEVNSLQAVDLTLKSVGQAAGINSFQRDSLALLDLYTSTAGGSWRHHDNWLSAQPLSTWYGVIVRNNRVTALSLDTNNLKGPLPVSFGDLTALDTLSLYYNFISGDFPSFIGNFTELTYFAAGRNYFTGSLPSSIGNLTALRILDIGQQQYMSGPLPSSIGNLTNLDTLTLFYIGATGTIPTSFGNLTKLQYLDISGNSWSDTLPAFLGNLANLTYLDISTNNNQGVFPSFLSKLTKLQVLFAHGVNITGTVPAFLGTLMSLQNISLENNQLISPVPSSLAALPNLAALDLRNNRFTFAGLEAIATAYKFAVYNEQDEIPVYYYNGTYSVSVGGTPSNNTYAWYKYKEDEDDDSLVVTKVSDSTFTPTSPGEYYVEVSNSIVTDDDNYNRDLYLYNEDIVLPVENPYILPASPATLFASREETDTTGWTNYYYDNNTPDDEDDDILVLALQKRGQNIGTVGDGTFKVQLTATDSAGSNTAIKLTNPLITNPSGFWVMNRFWNVIPASQPKSDIGIRFYYNNQDVTDINGSYPAHNLANDDLILYKEVGGSPDPTTNLSGATKIISILPGAYASDTTWTYHQLSDTSQYAEFSVASFSGGGGGGTGNGQALPVKLLYFTAAQNGEVNTLKWATANETNSSRFMVEKSTNGSQFTTIGTVDAKGNSSGNTPYSFTDNQLSSGTTYYRLRLVDKDGSFTYSETKSLQTALRFAAAIYPNPVKGNLSIHFTSDTNSKVTISIINIEGKQLLTEEVQLPTGMSLQVLPVASLSNGIYFLRYTSGNSEATIRFVKQ